MWTVDTLVLPEGTGAPSYLWGENKDNIWAVGSAYLNAYRMWHYNGESWTNHSPSEYIDPRGIFGINASDIWMGSTEGSLYHYNGSNWSKAITLSVPYFQSFVVQGICGTSSNDIYAVGYADSIDYIGYKGIIAHYDGSQWSILNIPSIKNSFSKIVYNQELSCYLISGWVFDFSAENIFKFDGTSLSQIYTSINHIGLYTILSKNYLAIDNILYSYGKSGLKIFKEFQSSIYAGGAWGRSTKDIFTINWEGIGHYNGDDLVTLYKKWNNDWSPIGVLIFDEDVYFIWIDFTKTYVVHGRLEN